MTTAVQFYNKDDQAGLTEIGPTGLPALEAAPNNKRGTGPKGEPTIEEITPWSQNSLEKHREKVKETLTLLQQGKEEAKIFIGNNTKERNGKEMVTGMLHEHLQKISNVSLKRMPSQATELLDTGSQIVPTEKQKGAIIEESTINHTEESKGK